MTDAHHFYGRRKGKPLHKSRAQSLGFVRDNYMIDVPETGIVDPACFFDRPLKKIALEIGFGNGEHIVNQAVLNPETGFIGCEPFINGVAAAARDVVEKNIGNIRFYPDDAMPLLMRFPDACLDTVFLLFPDPWPKTRHHKRRFIQRHTIELLGRVLRPGAQLVLATDDRNLADWMLLHTVLSPYFSWNNAQNAAWEKPPVHWVETRYQQKAAQQGRLAFFMSFTRL